MDPRDYFKELLRACNRARTIKRVADSLRNDESWRHSDGLCVKSGTLPDKTAERAARHIVGAKKLADELRGLVPTIIEGRAVCAFVADRCGDSFGYALYWKYMHGMTWKQVAEKMGCTAAMCSNKRASAMEYLDQVGMERAVAMAMLAREAQGEQASI